MNFRSGNLGDMAKAGTVHEFLVELHDKYGDIASFWWGEQITVSIASPSLFKEVRSMFDRPSKSNKINIAGTLEISIRALGYHLFVYLKKRMSF